jgi:hypothetical protein
MWKSCDKSLAHEGTLIFTWLFMWKLYGKFLAHEGALIFTYEFMLNSCEKFWYFIMHVKSHGEPCDVYVLGNFLFSFFFVNI